MIRADHTIKRPRIALQVDCPRCGAQTGQPCRTRTGNPNSNPNPHTARETLSDKYARILFLIARAGTPQ